MSEINEKAPRPPVCDADLRTRGWKYCVFAVVRNAKAKEHPGGSRTGFRRKGQRCRVLVDPKAITKFGVPICNKHEGLFLRAVKEDEERRQALRAKYDPGPLPLDVEP